MDAMGPFALPVVGRLVLSDQAQLADLGLEDGGALDAAHRLGKHHHLAHPGAGLRSREVRTDSRAQIPGGTDVEDMARGILEQVDTGGVGERLGEVPLAADLAADLGGEGLQLLQRVHTEIPEAGEETVEHIDRRAGIGERAMVGGGGRTEGHGQRTELAVGRVVTGDHATRQPGEYRLDIAPYIHFGASPRATIFLTRAARAMAFLDGRGYVTPQDVKSVGLDVLRHRIGITYEAEAEEVTPENLLQRIFDHLKVP